MLNKNVSEGILRNALREYSLKANSEQLIDTLMKDSDLIDEYTKLLIAKTLEDNDAMKIVVADYYDLGHLIKEDKGKAFELYSETYRNGNIKGCLNLGWYYYQNKNYMKAIEYFTECMKYEENLTDKDLGVCYANTGDSYLKIASPNLARAKENLEVAVEKYGNAYAAFRLGGLYSDQSTDYYNPVKAVHYFELGSRNGNVNATVALAEKYAFGDDSAGIVKNRSKAMELLEAYEDSQEVEVFELLGRIYLSYYDEENPDYYKARNAFQRVLDINEEYYKDGYIEQFLGFACYRISDYGDYDDAIKLLQVADENGYYLYSDELGHSCKVMRDKNGSYDLKDVFKYFDNAYKSGDISIFRCDEYIELLSDSMYVLCDYNKAYEVAEYGISTFNDVAFYSWKAKLVLSDKVKDKITKRDAAEIMEELKKYSVVKKEDYVLLGNYYMGVKDYRLGEMNFQTAFKEGVSEAGLVLARLYENGAGSIQANIQTAVEWYRKAANAGNKEAEAELSCFTEKLFGGYKRVRSL